LLTNQLENPKDGLVFYPIMSLTPSQYSEKHQLENVFHDLMKQVLDKKPDHPLDFLIDELTRVKKEGFNVIERNVIFVLGPPGSGKGTQSAKLVEEFGFIHLSAGDLLREEGKKESEEGLMIQEVIKNGRIVPGHITIRLLKKKIESYDSKTQFLIDGFPREMGQAIDFEREIVKAKYVLFFECPLEIVEKRILERGKTSGRSDDNAEALKKRFNTYISQTKPVIEYFGALDRVKKVDTTGDVESVYKEVKRIIGK